MIIFQNMLNIGKLFIIVGYVFVGVIVGKLGIFGGISNQCLVENGGCDNKCKIIIRFKV